MDQARNYWQQQELLNLTSVESFASQVDDRLIHCKVGELNNVD